MGKRLEETDLQNKKTKLVYEKPFNSYRNHGSSHWAATPMLETKQSSKLKILKSQNLENIKSCYLKNHENSGRGPNAD